MRKYLIILMILALALLPAGVLAEPDRGAYLSADCYPALSGENLSLAQEQFRDHVRGLLNQVNRTAFEEQLNTPVIGINGTEYCIRDLIRQRQGILENPSAYCPENLTWRFPGIFAGNFSRLPEGCQEFCQALINGEYEKYADCPYLEGTEEAQPGLTGMPRCRGAPSPDGSVPQAIVQPGEYLPYL
jgi:hypothetical protein